MTTSQLHWKYIASLDAANAAGTKAINAGARYMDWVNSSDDPPTADEMEASEDRAEWLKACDEYEFAKKVVREARAEYKNSITN